MNTKDETLLRDLNALIDGELDGVEQARVRQRLEHDAAARRHLAELRRVRALTQRALGASEPPCAPQRRTVLRARSIAAAALVAVGFALGWAMRPAAIPVPEDLPDHALALRAVQPEAGGRDVGVLVHIDRTDSAYVSLALDRIDAMLERYADKKQAIAVELVANADAINLLRADGSPHGRRLQAMRERHVNLTLVACKTTLERTRQERGEVRLLPGVDARDSALQRILSRLEKGWVYVRV